MIRVFKDNIILLLRSKFLLYTLLFLSGFTIYGTYKIYGKKVAPVQPLGNVMCLTVYLFFVMMFISYEYIQKFYNNGIYEILRVSDNKRKNIISAFAVLIIYSGILCITLSTLVIKEFLFFKICSPNNEYIKHILVCIFVNCFLVMVLAIVIGGALAPIGNRILVYSILAAFGILSSPFAEKMSYTIVLGDTSGGDIGGRIIYKLISYFYIIPRFDMKWMPRSEYGESVLPYRYFILFFWMFFFLTVMFIVNKKKSVSIFISGLMCIVMFIGYSFPSSKMDQRLDPYQNGISDMDYVRSGLYQEHVEAADYSITEYDMELDIRMELKASVKMKVTKSLNTYKMTLYRGYNILEIKDQTGAKLEFVRFGDYVKIKNSTGNHIKMLQIKYSGNSSGCYANYGGCYLPGFYLYYPRAGYLSVYSNDIAIKPHFVDQSTLFKVSVSPERKYISNLKKRGDKFIGRCDGFTLMKGFYKEKKFQDGNVLVYPYLDEFIIHDGKKSEEECWKDNFELTASELKKDKVKNSMIFMDLGVLSNSEYKARGKNQIFINAGGTFYVSD